MLWLILGALGALILWYVVTSVYLAYVLRWEDEQTVGLAYYGRPPAERERYRHQLERHARRLGPLLSLNARLGTLDFRRARIVYKGIAAPPGSCSVESFAKADAYQPRPEDIFVVTQMKCGTTWMQHVVYEVLHRGRGNLVETGTAMYAVAPWIEGRRSVPIEQAPLLGTERPSRIIKTHLPRSLCPYSREVRYIYVARHPVSCFASCVDFVVTNAGGMAPPMSKFEEWFCSPELMWWGTWTDHVAGWWRRAQEESNVLFVFFEDMKKDLAGVARRVAAFLGMAPLTDAELAEVVRKCGFKYMQEHQGNFEMQPPHVLQARAALFVSGSAERYKDVPDEMRQRLHDWVARELEGTGFPLAAAYPDVGGARRDAHVTARPSFSA
ncbi:MAG TPA: sulfotransferase domain-containing protein [Gemmatimonadaceae bacterium]